jgi:prepilin-type N-terminal cleavage/methylation domain-containing protein
VKLLRSPCFRPPRDDRGVTLIEVMVAMTLMSVAGAMFTGSIIQVYKSINKAESNYTAQSQINSAFSRLDKEIRYARSVSTPATVSGDYYVEYLVELSDVDTCVELRLHTSTSELQRRSWAQGVTPVAPTTWTTLATNITATTPFTTYGLDKNSLTGNRFQRLNITVTSKAGGATTGSTRQSNVTFTALNATATDNASTCVEGRSVSS